MYSIETKNLTKRYGKVIGVKDLNLRIRTGEIFGFIGPNGAGKTTTIRLFLDLIRPTSGSAEIFGLDVNRHSEEIKKMIGYLPGEVFLPEHLTGKAIIGYYKGFKEKIDEKYLKNLISILSVDLGKKLREYSKGNKQKLAVVLALMHQPRLLIMDEPTSGLDPVNQQEFYKMILEAKSRGITIFLSTHVLNETEKVCDRVGIIKSGKLLKIEDIDDFKKKNIRQIFVETAKTLPVGGLSKFNVKRIEKKPGGYELTVSGKIGELIREISKNQIDDYRIYEPLLEEIFFHYYEKH